MRVNVTGSLWTVEETLPYGTQRLTRRDGVTGYQSRSGFVYWAQRPDEANRRFAFACAAADLLQEPRDWSPSIVGEEFLTITHWTGKRVVLSAPSEIGSVVRR